MALQNFGGSFLTNLVTRPEFLAYTSEAIFEQSKFIQSGVVQRMPELDARAGGTRVRVPFFGPINPTEETITSGNNWGTSGAGYLTMQSVSATEQIATILHRGFAFATDDLSRLGSGADPLMHVRNQLAQAINKKKTATLLAQLTGLFGGIAGDGVLGPNALDVTATSSPTADNYLTASNVVKAKYKLGERGDQVTTIAMHSAVAAYLQQTGFLQVQVSGSNVLSGPGTVDRPAVTTFAGLNVIVDDQLTALTGGTTGQPYKYPVYLFGQGVVGEGLQQDMRLDTDRNKPSFQDILLADYHYGFHIAGTKWAAAGDNPTNASTSGNLANKGSWGLAYSNSKLIPIVRMAVNTPFDLTAY